MHKLLFFTIIFIESVVEQANVLCGMIKNGVSLHFSSEILILSAAVLFKQVSPYRATHHSGLCLASSIVSY